jgi:hypothetical protein
VKHASLRLGEALRSDAAARRALWAGGQNRGARWSSRTLAGCGCRISRGALDAARDGFGLGRLGFPRARTLALRLGTGPSGNRGRAEDARRAGSVYWRKYTDTGGWEAEQGPVAMGVGSAPVLASEAEDRQSPGTDLWLLYRTSAGRIAYRLFNHGTSTWGSEELLGRPPDAPVTDNRVGAVVYGGRLHVSGKTGNDMYYASCKMPCAGEWDDWTRWVKQDGDTGDFTKLEAFGANDGYLYLWHDLASSSALHARIKVSE